MFNFWLIYWVFRPSGATPRSPGLRPVSSIMKLVPSPILVEGRRCIFRVHDSVRSSGKNDFSDLVDGASEYGGCLPVLPLTDTVYQTADGKVIDKLLNRDTLFTGQTPEVFRLNEYHRINHSVSLNELDSYRGAAQLAHQYGMKVHLIPGEYTNFKLTIPSDLQKFRAICEEKK